MSQTAHPGLQPILLTDRSAVVTDAGRGIGRACAECLTLAGAWVSAAARMAIDVVPYNIRVNAVAPTSIPTPLTRPILDDPAFHAEVMQKIPSNRVGQVEGAATTILFLCSDAASLLTAESPKIDGRWTAQ